VRLERVKGIREQGNCQTDKGVCSLDGIKTAAFGGGVRDCGM
jgi:hypothetical protein